MGKPFGNDFYVDIVCKSDDSREQTLGRNGVFAVADESPQPWASTVADSCAAGVLIETEYIEAVYWCRLVYWMRCSGLIIDFFPFGTIVAPLDPTHRH
jgi:hypothetical protein